MCFQNHSASHDSVIPADRMIDGRIMAGTNFDGARAARSEASWNAPLLWRFGTSDGPASRFNF
jgi:hypothetical protein